MRTMPLAGMAANGPFRGFLPYDESGAAVFFGRRDEADALFQQVIRDGVRVSALTGESGVGKTSLLRAGLTPRLAKQGIQCLYLARYGSLEQEVWHAASRASAEPPSTGEGPVEYLVRVSRSARGGTVLVLDHLEELLAAQPGAPLRALAELLSRAEAAAGPRLRVLMCVDSGAFHRLDLLHAASGFSPMAGNWRELARLNAEQIADILEQTALQTGTFFEAGLAAAIAGDLCRKGPASPLDLQLVARAVMDLRLTSIRRYERAGGADVIVPQLFDRYVREAGGPAGRRVLLDLAAAGGSAAEEISARTHVGRDEVERSLAAFVSRGVVRKHEPDRGERFELTHPALRAHVESFTALERARGDGARRMLRRRILAGRRLALPEVVSVWRHLGGALAPEEVLAVRRSVRRGAIHIGIGLAVVLAVAVAVVVKLRGSYTLALDPPGDPAGARVVVKKGRPSFGALSWLPGSPSTNDVFADTGFAASGLASDVNMRIAAGKVTGALNRDPRPRLPAWLRATLDGLRPVPRGVALVLLGDPGGVTSLKQAFSDPVSRREALDTLAVIGTGRAGEDEILAAALGDPSAEIRRRGVEVAAAIDRRLAGGSHGATLRSALGDKSFEVKNAVIRECASLAPNEASGILAVALADRDAGFRRLAEKAVMELAARSPAAAAAATRPAALSPDALARRTGLGLLEAIATRAPLPSAPVLRDLVADEKAPEETRVAALLFLRRPGIPLEDLRPVLEKAAVGPESSPRLKTAALPLYARLIDPEQALQLAQAESKGAPAERAARAAVWGAVAAKQPEAAVKALKASLYDPSPEVRIEAARSYGFLKREGMGLVQKAIMDPHPEVMRAALDSAVTLSQAQPYAAAEVLGRAFILVRPGLRRHVVEALGRVGTERPAAVVPPLARALKTGDGNSRAAAATALCGLAKKTPDAVSPYLRVAARDPDRDVRTAVAGCLGTLGDSDPRAGARLAGELAAADEPTVRAAAAASLGPLAPKAADAVVAPLVRLLADPDRHVRVAAVSTLEAYGRATKGKAGDELEKAALAALTQGDVEERRALVRAAATARLFGILRQAAADPDELVRLETLKLVSSNTDEGLAILQSAVEDRASLVRSEAIRRLAAVRGDGSRHALPVLQATIRSGDLAARRASVLALGEMVDAAPEASRILGEVLRLRSEILRADAAEALGHMAMRAPEPTVALLERALRDPAHDVRVAAVRGLGAVWAKQHAPDELARRLEGSERDSAQRLVALEALVRTAQEPGTKRTSAQKALAQIAANGPPLARLAAQVGMAFVNGKPEEMHAFLERLYGG